MEEREQGNNEVKGQEEYIKVEPKNIYKVEVSFEISEDERAEKEYHFKKPSVSSYDRYIKTTSKSPTKANRAFVLDNIVPEQKQQITADLDQYPAMSIIISDKLLSMLGLGDATLTKL